jgi:DNA-binding MarR family transcriptional regulator
VKGLHGFAVLVQRCDPHLDEAVRRPRPRQPGFDDLGDDAQHVAGAHRRRPGQFAADAEDPASRAEFAGDQQPHRHRGGVPTARRQAAEQALAPGFVVEMKRLRVELGGERRDRRGLDPQRRRGVALPGGEILEKQRRHGRTGTKVHMRLYMAAPDSCPATRPGSGRGPLNIDDCATARVCNCLAIRQAARHVTQYYDQVFAPIGLRATQFATLSRLRRDGPMPINALASALVMDRTTLGRNILPLQRDGLIEIVVSAEDRRRRELRLTAAGVARQGAGSERWALAQAAFDGAIGRKRAAKMRKMMREVAACEFSDGA